MIREERELELWRTEKNYMSARVELVVYTRVGEFG